MREERAAFKNQGKKYAASGFELPNRKLRDIKTYNSEAISFLLVDKNTPSGE